MQPLRRLALLPLAALALTLAPALAYAADPLRFVPKEASSVVHIDVAGALGQNLVKLARKDLLDLAGATRDIQNLKRDVGFDVMTGLATVTFAGTDKAARKSDESLLVLGFRGPAPDAGKLASYYAKRAGTSPKTASHEGYTVHVIGPDSWLVFADGHALVGDKGLVASALSALKAGRPSLKPTLASALPATAARKHAWGAAVGSADLGGVLGRSDPRLKALRAMAFSLDLTRGLELDVAATFPDAASAEAMRAEIVQDLKNIAAEQDVKELGLDAVIGGLSASASGAVLKFRAAITGALATKLTNALQTMLQ
jgi:hypothetical protein